MFKNLLLTSFFLLNLIGIFYPSEKENTKLFDYCNTLEIILSRNLLNKRKNPSQNVMLISKDLLKFGVSKTRGVLINKIIDKYKASKNSQIIKIVPNRVYCYAGYWIENIKPGTFESFFYSKSNKEINKFKDLKNEVDGILNDINGEYKFIKKEFNSLF